MAQSLASWISKSIVQHDREHGADFDTPWTGSSKCGQLVKFTTYRTAENPHAVVRGVISDRTHTVAIEFDAAATDAFETSVAGEHAESLTSCLRAVVRLKAFAFRVNAPATGSDVPRVSLHARAWEVVSGDRSDPVFYSQAVDVSNDEGVHSVLRKWWFGV
ncbi:uncharacterized protein LOC62_05G007740 [Vanrija pseudolonga]|uniref:Telomere replication protein EST3 n=1 Tax=Vanrija pseudolonga TaxID=143232 RepID=A0AAF0YHT6_9TREE|nr:hypothetical protein LOC62_05G007740 [Vanrija pseudolonga]